MTMYARCARFKFGRLSSWYRQASRLGRGQCCDTYVLDRRSSSRWQWVSSSQSSFGSPWPRPSRVTIVSTFRVCLWAAQSYQVSAVVRAGASATSAANRSRAVGESVAQLPSRSAARISKERSRAAWSKIMAVAISSSTFVSRRKVVTPCRTVAGPPTTA
jgi:hypothetical protein